MSDDTPAQCAECGRQDVRTVGDRLVAHQTVNSGSGRQCPGGGDAPSRATEARYGPTSQYQSCPAATGEPRTARQRCTQFADGAHRCGQQRSHQALEHQCTCGYRWTSATAATQQWQPRIPLSTRAEVDTDWCAPSITPDGKYTTQPNWAYVDLEQAGMSELIEIRISDKAMRQHLRKGAITAEIWRPQSFVDAAVVHVIVDEGQRKYVLIEDDLELVIR